MIKLKHVDDEITQIMITPIVTFKAEILVVAAAHRGHDPPFAAPLPLSLNVAVLPYPPITTSHPWFKPQG